MTYSAEVLADSPRAYWRLGDASGSTMTDSSGNARSGTYSGGGAQPTLGVAGLLVGDADTAVSWDGSDRADVIDAAWMDSTVVTLEAWVKPTNVTGTRMILYRDNTNFAGANMRYWQLLHVAGVPQFTFWASDGGATQNVIGTTTMSSGSTYHIVGTYDGSVGRLYVNGVQEASVSIGGAIQSSATGAPIQIASTGAASFFIGTLDELAFYGAALSGARVAAHYLAGTVATPGVPTGLAVDDEDLTTLDVSWAAASGSPTGYRVRLDAGASTDVGNVLSHQFTGLTPGTTYAVQVQAYNAAGDSAWSSAVNGTTDDLLAPDNLTIVSVFPTSVSVEWDASTGALGYRVRADGGAPEDVGDVLEHTFAGLEPDTSHTLEVQAYL